MAMVDLELWKANRKINKYREEVRNWNDRLLTPEARRVCGCTDSKIRRYLDKAMLNLDKALEKRNCAKIQKGHDDAVYEDFTGIGVEYWEPDDEKS